MVVKYIAIAIDGPAGSGKSSVAKEIARILNFNYLNTGLMYRAIAYLSLKKNWDLNNASSIIKKFQLETIIFNNDDDVQYKGKNIATYLRENEISALAAKVAQNKEIRAFCVVLQQKMAIGKKIVMDGRDIGSVVLPDAQLKIYMWAKPEVRAQRRFDQNKKLLIKENFKDLLEEIKMRDKEDIERKNSPLVMVKDAIKMDTTNLTLKEVINKVIDLWKKDPIEFSNE